MRTRSSPADADRAREHSADRLAPLPAWMAVTLLFGCAALLLSAYLPPALLLATMSVLMVVVGFSLAAAWWLAGRSAGGLKELAAALVFLGFAGTILTDSGQALSQLQQLETRALAAASK